MKSLASLAVACCIVLFLSDSAGATRATTGHRTVRDKVGDSAPRFDITKVSVRQTDKRVRLVLHIRDLSKTAEATFEVNGDIFKFDGMPHYSDVQAATWVNAHGRTRVILYEGEDGLPTTCKSLHARWRTALNRILIVSPVKCGQAHWQGRKFSAESLRPSGKLADRVGVFRLN